MTRSIVLASLLALILVTGTACAEVHQLNNLAKGMPYILDPLPHTSYPDPNLTKLTDGRYAFSLGDAAGWTSGMPSPVITVDLGQVVEGIRHVSASFLRASAWAVAMPRAITVRGSVDGEHFVDVARTTALLPERPAEQAVNAIYWEDEEGFTARYVQIEVHQTSAGWMLMNEVVVSTDRLPATRMDGDAKAVVRGADERQPAELRLTGTFLQLNSMLAARSIPDWRLELQWMKEAGMELVIIQSASHGQAFWYPRQGRFARDVIGTIIAEAEAQGMKVMLGLDSDPMFWDKPLDEGIATSLDVAAELYERYGSSPAFAGWYLPHELSDLTFVTQSNFDAAVYAFKKKVEGLKELSPEVPVAMAPYFGQYLYPWEFAEVWAKFLDEVPVDIVMLQDGVGGIHRDPEDIEPYFAALAEVVRDRDVALWSDLEIFAQTYTVGGDGQFRAVPAPIDRVIRQMEVAAPYVERIVIFDFSHYMSPRDAARKELYEAYLGWLGG